MSFENIPAPSPDNSESALAARREANVGLIRDIHMYHPEMTPRSAQLGVLKERLLRANPSALRFYPDAFLGTCDYQSFPGRKEHGDEKDLIARLDIALLDFETHSPEPTLSQTELTALSRVYFEGQKRMTTLRARIQLLPEKVGRKAWLSALTQAETDFKEGHDHWKFSQLNDALDELAYLEDRCSQLEKNPQTLSQQFLAFLNTLDEEGLHEYMTVERTGAKARLNFHFADPFEGMASRIQHFIGPNPTTLGIKIPVAQLPNCILKKAGVAYSWSPSKETWCDSQQKSLTIRDGTCVDFERVSGPKKGASAPEDNRMATLDGTTVNRSAS